MPGSKMFIEPRRPVSVDEFDPRHGGAFSGNDACIALAEAAAGTEEAFVQRMNREGRAARHEEIALHERHGRRTRRHYSTAQDLHLLAAALTAISFRVRAVLLAEGIGITGEPAQRNRLLWLDPSVDGVQTGYTESAGYCLIASARRGGRRLLSVLLGATSESARSQESQKLLTGVSATSTT